MDAAEFSKYAGLLSVALSQHHLLGFEFNSDGHYIYYCEQESLRRSGVTIIVNKRVQNEVLECSFKNYRIISVRFQDKTFNIMVMYLSLKDDAEKVLHSIC